MTLLLAMLCIPLASRSEEIGIPYCRTAAAPILLDDALKIYTANERAISLATRMTLASELFRLDSGRARALFQSSFVEIQAIADGSERIAMLERLAHHLPPAFSDLEKSVIGEIRAAALPAREPEQRLSRSVWYPNPMSEALRLLGLDYALAALSRNEETRRSILKEIDDWTARNPRLRDDDIELGSQEELTSYLQYLDPWLEYQYSHDRSGRAGPSLFMIGEASRLSETPMRDSGFLREMIEASSDFTEQLDLAVALYQFGATLAPTAVSIMRQYERGNMRNSLVRARFMDFCIALSHCKARESARLIGEMTNPKGRQEVLDAIMPILSRTSPRIASEIFLPVADDPDGAYALMVIAGLGQANEIPVAEDLIRKMPATAWRAFAEKILGALTEDATRVRRADTAVAAFLHDAWVADVNETYGPRMGRFPRLRTLLSPLFQYYDLAKAQQLLTQAVPPLDPGDSEAAGMTPVLLDIADRDPSWALTVFKKDAPVRFKRNESVVMHSVSVLLPILARADSAFVRDYIARYGTSEHPQTRQVMEREITANLARDPLRIAKEQLLEGQGNLASLPAVVLKMADPRDKDAFLVASAISFYHLYRVSEAMTIAALIESPDARLQALVGMAAQARVEDTRERFPFLARPTSGR